MNHKTLSVFNYTGKNICDLYDNNIQAYGQPHDIQHVIDKNGNKTLSFQMPYLIDDVGKNFRWQYVVNEYLIRVTEGDKVDWFIIDDPKKTKNTGITEEVTCSHISSILKTKNIYMVFDDENGIGTINYLMEQAIKGTGWTLGDVDTFYESDGSTEKIRSFASDGKKGAYQLVIDICNLFDGYPIFNGDSKTIDIHCINNREKEWELMVGRNMSSLAPEYDSKDIITRLYVEGEYGDYGYVGIDDVNPTGLNFIVNFDYYRQVGLFEDVHETALATYLTDIKEVNDRIKEQMAHINAYNDTLATNWGVIKYVVYKLESGAITRTILGNGATTDEAAFHGGDELYIVQSDGKYRMEMLTSDPTFLTTDTYAVKMIEKAAGLVGAREATVIAKTKLIKGWQDDIDREMAKEEPDMTKIADWEHNIDVLEEEIEQQYDGTLVSIGLYELIRNSTQTANDLYIAEQTLTGMQEEQLDIEADFAIAMGDMLKDGYWSDQNYIPGQEQFLYNDAVEVMEAMSKPSVKYSLSIVPVAEGMGVTIDDIPINSVGHIMDEDLGVNDRGYVSKVTRYLDDPSKGSVEIVNQDVTLTGTSLESVLSRVVQLADIIDQKKSLYDRAEAITSEGNIYVERLEGTIDVMSNQITSSVSNWYTDASGNLVFESTNGLGAMMLSGEGYLIADGKDEDGNWNWRTAGTGRGLVADTITTGYLSSDRIEAGSIVTNKLAPEVGQELDIEGNGTIIRIDQEIEMIASKTGNRTYIYPDDPRNHDDPLTPEGEEPKKISPIYGDYWVQRYDHRLLWQDAKDMTVEYLKDNYTWMAAVGSVQHWCWDGTQWIPVNDVEQISEMWSKISVNARDITLESKRASAAEGELDAKITVTAESITSEVQKGLNGEEGYTSIYQTAEQVTQTVEDKAYGKVSQVAIDANGIHLKSSGASTSAIDITPTGIDMKSQKLNVGTGGSIDVASGGSIDVESGGNIDVKSGSNLTVESGGSVEIKNGANNIVTMDNTGINVASAGAIKVAGGSGNIIEMDSSGLTVESGGGIEIKNGDGNNAITMDENGMNVTTNGALIIDSGGTFRVTSPNFTIFDDGTISVQNVEINGSLQSNSSDVWTKDMLDIVVSETEPSAKLGRIWIKPISGGGGEVDPVWQDVVTYSHKMARPSRLSLASSKFPYGNSSSREGNDTRLTGTATSDITGATRHSYKLYFPVFCSSVVSTAVTLRATIVYNGTSYTSTVTTAFPYGSTTVEFKFDNITAWMGGAGSSGIRFYVEVTNTAGEKGYNVLNGSESTTATLVMSSSKT